MPLRMSEPFILNKKGQVSFEDLKDIRAQLAGNCLALNNIGGMLRLANNMLSDCQARFPHSVTCIAEVKFGEQVFRFCR